MVSRIVMRQVARLQDRFGSGDEEEKFLSEPR
jgi:hypothetical protein